MPTPNPYKRLAQFDKATKLADVIDANWETLALVVGITTPSAETQKLVVAMLAARITARERAAVK